MAEPIAEYGNEAGFCGHDGSVWVKVKVDADGHLQVDGLSTALPTDAATATNQATMITALQLIDDLRNALVSVATDQLQIKVNSSALPTGAATSIMQVAINSELQQKLETADLNLDGEKDLQVDVKTAPTTAVTIADGVDVVAGAVADAVVAAGAVGSLSAKLRRLTTDLDALLTELKLKADLTETQPVSIATMPTVTVQAAGGDKLWGFESIVEESLVDDNLSAGTNFLTGTAVPTGKVWELNVVAFYYVGTPPSSMLLQVGGLATALALYHELSVTSARWYIWTGAVRMAAGDYVELVVYGATAGDYATLRYAGVQMDAPA